MTVNAGALPVAPRTRVSNGAMAIVFLLATEVMFFAALVSAYLVSRANVLLWPPLDQPRLPVLQTAFNTVVLLASGITMAGAVRSRAASPRRTKRLLVGTLALGSAFVVLQGVEWLRLLAFGLNGKTSTYAAFFYLIVGAHAAHVVGGLLVLIAAIVGWLERRSLHLGAMYWAFVVGLWPILYVLVYLL